MQTLGESLGLLLRIGFWIGCVVGCMYIGYAVFGGEDKRKRESQEWENENLKRKIQFLEHNIDFLTKVNAELQEKLHSYGNKKV